MIKKRSDIFHIITGFVICMHFFSFAPLKSPNFTDVISFIIIVYAYTSFPRSSIIAFTLSPSRVERIV